MTTGFRPRTSGFAFGNDWPAQPVVHVPTPWGRLDLGDAQGGLCGGMAFAALDYWHAGRTPPARRPVKGDPLYDFIVRRLFDSWHLPAGIARYYRWMMCSDAWCSHRTLGRQLHLIRQDLAGGRPVPLGVVTVRSSRPADLALNHQVLAYACEGTAGAVSLRVYDPNSPGRDDISIDFDASGPATFEHNLGLGLPVRGFFRIGYTPAVP